MIKELLVGILAGIIVLPIGSIKFHKWFKRIKDDKAKTIKSIKNKFNTNKKAEIPDIKKTLSNRLNNNPILKSQIIEFLEEDINTESESRMHYLINRIKRL